MSAKLVAVFVSLFILFLIIDLIRREKLTFKYAVGWIIASLLGITFAVCEGLLVKVSRFFGFDLPSNFIFFSLIGILTLMTLLMTLFLCQQNRRNDIIAQKISLLELEICKSDKKDLTGTIDKK